MNRRMMLAAALALGAFATSAFVTGAFAAGDKMVITLKDGDVVIGLRPDLAPKHVAQIEKLVREGAYDNVVFHRVIDGFMAQTGDVQYGNAQKGFDASAVGTGGSKEPDLPEEFSRSEHFERGTVGMARAADPDSANSQFFIMFAPASSLDGQYTIVGKVEKGMDLVDRIKKGEESQNGAVDAPDRMLKVRITK